MGNAARSRIKWPILAVLFLAYALLVPKTALNFWLLVKDLPAYVKSIARTTLEDRKTAYYGYGNRIGYGYLKKIMAGYPEPGKFPVMRYKDWDHHAEIYFPGRYYETDDRMLVGIGLTTEDLADSPIAKATRLRHDVNEGKARSVWALTTPYVNDSLSGFDFYFKDLGIKGPQAVSVVLQDSPNGNVITKWHIPVSSLQEPVHYSLNEPIKGFSTMMDREPFVLLVENHPAVPPAGVAEIVRIDATGTKVELKDYRVIETEGGCFTAVKQSFYDEIMSGGPSAWKEYIERFSRG